MTEENAVQIADPIPEITPEQLKVLRATLLNLAKTNYKTLIDFIRSLPIHPQIYHSSILFFDTGMLWLNEIISHSPIMKNSIPSEPNNLNQG